MTLSRRSLLSAGAVSLAFSGLARAQEAPETYRNEVTGYGPLRADPNGVFDLPEGFSYRVVSFAGQTMNDGYVVPANADGMACFAGRGAKVILMRNHENGLKHRNLGPLGIGRSLRKRPKPDKVFDVDATCEPLSGGVSRLVYDTDAGRLVRAEMALFGTSTNCSGGPTPWGSWLTCEETTTGPAEGLGQTHGWVFEVPARGRGLADPVPLKAMGRFFHEAAAVDPVTGIVYLTEDAPAPDRAGLLYRYLPASPGQLALGGRLQALAFRDAPGADARNWDGRVTWKQGDVRQAAWVDLTDVESPDDDLRHRGHAAGAVILGRGEGLFRGQDGFYMSCTNSGPAKHGQILRYRPSPHEGQPGEADAPGTLELFIESTDDRVLDYPDNLTVAPNGHLLVCEDRYSATLRNHLRAITPDGRTYTLGRNVYRDNAELAGVCFSPDGQTMFVNIYWPGITLAVTGPWAALRP
jgi:secreted PhoX family phosphatase